MKNGPIKIEDGCPIQEIYDIIPQGTLMFMEGDDFPTLFFGHTGVITLPDAEKLVKFMKEFDKKAREKLFGKRKKKQ